jgi:hypothetical protein
MTLLIVLIHNVNAQTIGFNIILEKPSFLRYEIVSFKVNLTQDGNPITDSSAYLTARFYNSTGHLVTTVGNMQSINLYYNSSDSLWYGYWPIPWNPELGVYTLNVTANISGIVYTDSKQFEIRMREVREVLPPGFLAMTAEQLESHIDYGRLQIPGPYNETINWTNIFKWANFMGADAVWPTKGYIAGYGGCNYYAPVNQSFPWCSNSYHGYQIECQKAKEEGFRCGAWIWPYSVFASADAEKNFGITFNWTLKYDCSNDQIVNTIGDISILDERAINHTVKMIRLLNISSIDMIGIDWEPSTAVDLRLVNDEFVREMNLPVPPDWNSYSQEEKMKWVGRRITYGCSGYNSTILEIWKRWMAFNYAKTIEKIINESGFHGSFFMFTWEDVHGIHSPSIIHDAGIDVIAPMLYTAPARAGRSGNPCWYETAMVWPWGREITKEKVPNVVGGQIVLDVAYVNCSYMHTREYPAPLEMYDRMMISATQMYKDGNITGLFWHDIYRCAGGGYATPYPYSCAEYAIAGGAAASDLRLKAGRIPVNLSIEAPDEVWYGDSFSGNITVTNLGSSSLNVNVILINNTPGWEFITAPNTIISLAPSETKKVSFTVKSNLRNYNVDNRFMIAAKAVFGSNSTDQHLEFKYVHAKPKSIFSGRLKDKNNNPLQGKVIVYQRGTNNISSINQTDSQGNYYFFIPSGIYDIEYNLTEFSFKLNDMDLSYDLYEPVSYLVKEENRITIGLNTNKSNFNPQKIEVIFPTRNPVRILKNNTDLERVYSLAELKSNKWFYNSSEQKIYLLTDRFLIGFAPLFGNPEVGGSGTGWNPYIYTAGPYDVNETIKVSSIYLYVATTGRAKVAIYDAIYNPNQYLTKHNPNNLIIQSGEQECKAGDWCVFDIQDTQLLPGKYFLAIKINTSLMLTAIPRGGFGQWRTHNYADPFPNPFGPVPDATGAEYSIYACCS